MLRRCTAFLLYASFIRNKRRAAGNCVRNYLNSDEAQPIGGAISKRYQALCRKRRKRRKPLSSLTAVHALIFRTARVPRAHVLEAAPGD